MSLEDLRKNIEARRKLLEEQRKKTEKSIRRKLVETELELSRSQEELNFTRWQLFKSKFAVDYFDIAVWIFGIFFVSTYFWLPILQGLGILIGIALLSTLVIKSNLIQLIAITFSMIYFWLSFITGIFTPFFDVFILIFGFNTITLFPILVSTFIFASVVGIGLISGSKQSFWWLMYLVPVIAFSLALLDTLISMTLIGFVATPIQLFWILAIFLVIHFSLYLVSFWLTYALTYGISRLFLYVLKKATEQEKEIRELQVEEVVTKYK